MNARDPGTDATFDWLREAHRSERAPAELRRRAQEQARRVRAGSERAEPRSKWLARGGWLALAALAAAGGWLAFARPALDVAPHRPTAAGDITTPTAEPSRAGAPEAPCPHAPEWLRTPDEIDGSAKPFGFGSKLVEVETPGCGLLKRRYLIRPPIALAPHVPVLIVLHDAGQSAETAQVTTRWWYDDLSQRKFVLLVYANGLPPSRPVVGYEGVWQTDADAQPRVDDVAYLDAIVEDLRRQGLAQREVFLAGQGSGGVMALAAALQHPDRYAGVAAFLPSRALTPVEVKAVQEATGQYPLRSIFIALPRSPQHNPSQLVIDWAAQLGSEHGAIHAARRRPGVGQIDSPLANGVRLRIATLPQEVDPFPPPGGADGPARAASEKSPSFFDGPGAAWELFESHESKPPFTRQGKR